MTIDKQIYNIGGRECTFFSAGKAQTVLVQVVSPRQCDELDRQVELIASAGIPFLLAAVPIVDWELELMPWPELVVSRRPEVGTGAQATLDYIVDSLLPYICGGGCPATKALTDNAPVVLGGYSLGGLFALWAARQTDCFVAVAAASPSLWAGDWPAFADQHPVRSQRVYLSLGDREEHTKNKAMARSGDRIRGEYARLQGQIGASNCTLVWEQGGHFNDPAGRLARAYRWCLTGLTVGPVDRHPAAQCE